MKVANIKHYLIKIDLEWKLAPERIIKDYFNNEIASNKQVYQIHLIQKTHKVLKKYF